GRVTRQLVKSNPLRNGEGDQPPQADGGGAARAVVPTPPPRSFAAWSPSPCRGGLVQRTKLAPLASTTAPLAEAGASTASQRAISPISPVVAGRPSGMSD